MSAPERVLHVITPAAAGCGAAMLRLVGETRRLLPEFDHHLLVLGCARWSEAAHRAGAGPHRRLPPLFGVPSLSARTIRAAMAALGADLIHAWDSVSVELIVAGRPAEGVAATLGAVPPHRGATPLALDRVEALCLGERARRQALAAGWLHARLRAAMPPTLASNASAGSAETRRARRSAIRAEWEVDEETIVVAVTTDPPSAADAWLAFEMAARAVLGGHRVRLLCDAMALSVGEHSRWSSLPALRGMLRVDPRAEFPWEIDDAIDAALLPERGDPRRGERWPPGPPGGPPSGPLAPYWLHAAGVPLIVTRDGPLDGLRVGDGMTVIEPRPNSGAVAIGRLAVRDPGAGGSRVALGAARSDAPADDGGAAEWTSSVRDLYRRAAASAAGPRLAARSERAASR